MTRYANFTVKEIEEEIRIRKSMLRSGCGSSDEADVTEEDLEMLQYEIQELESALIIAIKN